VGDVSEARAGQPDLPERQRPAAVASAGGASPRGILVPLALAQFICSFAGSNMNVAINSIAEDIGTTVHGVQTAITLFLLVMAALMIPGSKLTDRWGRKRCFIGGLSIYGVGAVIAALAPGLGLLIVGYSVFEGVGSALLIPPVYILTTMVFGDIKSRARAFGIISGMGGVGAAAGPLVGGLITTTISWRASFLLQAAVVAAIILLSRRIVDPVPADPTRPFDSVGAALSALGMFFVVIGILQAGSDRALLVLFLALGAAFLAWFFLHIRSRERGGKEPLLSTALFHVRVSNFGLVTQNVQWLLLMGISFVVSVFLQVVRGFSAIETGLVFTAATIGILLSSLAAARLARRYAQKSLVLAGFVTTLAGIGLLLGLAVAFSSVLVFLPGLFVIGVGVGVMLTPSVNIVQSAFPEEKQGEISGLSRSISNLGSSLGTAIAGTVLVSDLLPGNRTYALAMAVLAGIGAIGLVAALFLPSRPGPGGAGDTASP
jgi:MFS family permease